MALVNYYLTDSEGDTDVEEDTPPVSFSAPTPVTEAAPPVEPPAGPRRPHWLPPVRPLAGPPVRFSAPTPVTEIFMLSSCRPVDDMLSCCGSTFDL